MIADNRPKNPKKDAATPNAPGLQSSCNQKQLAWKRKKGGNPDIGLSTLP
jgi:hypothetical protein